MICKWCGNSMSPSETKCKRCGKEAPALSDCGGFYDIAPKARKAAEAPPSPVNNIPCQHQPVREPVPAKKSKNNNIKKLFLALTAITFAVFVALLVFLFILLGKVNNLSEEVENLQENMATVNEILDIDKDEDKDKDKKEDKNEDKGKDKYKDNGLTTTEHNTTNPNEAESSTRKPYYAEINPTATNPAETFTDDNGSDVTSETSTDDNGNDDSGKNSLGSEIPSETTANDTGSDDSGKNPSDSEVTSKINSGRSRNNYGLTN